MAYTLTLSERDIDALRRLADTVLADVHHYEPTGDEQDDRVSFMRELRDKQVDDTLTLTKRERFHLDTICRDVLKALDDESANRHALAPAAHVLARVTSFPDDAEDLLYWRSSRPYDDHEAFYAELATVPFTSEKRHLFATPTGILHLLRLTLKHLIRHGAVLDVTQTSRRTAGELRRAVDFAYHSRLRDRDDETWFMTRSDLAQLVRLLERVQTHARTNVRFEVYRTTAFDDITRALQRTYLAQTGPTDTSKGDVTHETT